MFICVCKKLKVKKDLVMNFVTDILFVSSKWWHVLEHYRKTQKNCFICAKSTKNKPKPKREDPQEWLRNDQIQNHNRISVLSICGKRNPKLGIFKCDVIESYKPIWHTQ